MMTPPRFDMPPPPASFETRGGWLVGRLIADFALTTNQAAGIVGNLGFESGGFETLQEIAPAAGRGGYGWAQWTGPRRVAFEQWAAAQGLDLASDAANYGYLCEELCTTQAHALQQLKKTTTLEAAVFTFGFFFEHPGGTTSQHLPGFADRLKYAHRALAGAPASLPPPSPTWTPAAGPPAAVSPTPPSPSPLPAPLGDQRMGASNELPWQAKLALSGFVFLLMGAALALSYLADDPSNRQIIIGAIIASFASTVSFYFGSSDSSQKKDATIAAQGAALATSTPAPPPPRA